MQAQGGHDCVDLQRLRDRRGTVHADVVAAQLQGGHYRVDLQRLRDRLGTLNPDGVAPEVEGGHDRRARLEGLGDGFGTLIPDLVAPELELGHHRCDWNETRNEHGALGADHSLLYIETADRIGAQLLNRDATGLSRASAGNGSEQQW